MSKDFSFAVMPSVSISRSRFARKSQHKTSFNLGDIVPIYVDEVLPGSTKSFDFASLVRMSTPIAPIMDNIYLDLYAFFVPNRLVWIHWKEFMGENNTSAGIPAVSYQVPSLTFDGGDTSDDDDMISAGSLGDYMGLPVGVKLGDRVDSFEINALPFRAYYLIYNEWFRNQNLIAPVPIDTSDSNKVIIGTGFDGTLSLKKAAKLADYFTKSLPYAQKGTPVTLPLGGTAPVYAVANATEGVTGGSNIRAVNISASAGSSTKVPLVPANQSQSNTTTSIIADLSNATAATINQLRFAFQLQKLLEKDALYGTRYWEILKAHFGVSAPDASLQRPEYLGGQRIRINVDQVLSTAGYDASTSTTVGAPGANSVSAAKGSLFTKSFCEHGFIMVVAVARHDQTYTQGINRMFSRFGRYDYYWPVFANLAAQAILHKEIYAASATPNAVWSYQEAWAEYRYKPSIATAKMRPTSGNLTYWTLANNFGSTPTLGQTFIEQDRNAIQRALVSGSSGPDFIADFYFEDVSVLPMPTYSIPGLVDHH